MSKENNGWISIKEQLPEQGRNVLIFVPTLNSDNHQQIDIGWLDDGSNGVQCFVGSDFGFDLLDITHWQPLPKPPTT